MINKYLNNYKHKKFLFILLYNLINYNLLMFETSKKRKQKKRYYKKASKFRYIYKDKLKPKNILCKKKFYLLLFLFILYFSIFFNKIKIINKKETKICICTLAKQENLYVREYLEHYKKYGVNKIYLYDNNDINGEKFEDVISDYIKSGFVEIPNWRGRKRIQLKILNECYRNHKDEYDWIMFSEIDEFIHLYNNYTKVSTFLNEPKFNNCEVVHLNLVCHSDNDQLYYENRPVKERFPNFVPSSMIGGRRLEIKFILRGHLNNTHISCLHRGNAKLKDCDGFGRAGKYKSIFTKEPDYTYYYYDHYYGKSTEEFAKKVKRGDGLYPEEQFQRGRIKKYFEENKLTMEKVLIIENITRLNLFKYKNKLKHFS